MFSGGIGKIVLMVVAIVVLAILMPIVMDQAVVITTDPNIANFTGLSAFVNLTPLLLWLGATFGLLGYAGFTAYKSYKNKGGTKAKASR